MRTLSSALILKLVDWFIPARLRSGAAVYRRAQMYLVAHLFGPPFGLLCCLYAYLVDLHRGAAFWIVTCGGFAFYIYPFILRLTGRLTLVAPISIQHLTFLILVGSFGYGGVASPFLCWLGVVPLLAAFYVHGRPLVRAVVVAMTFAQILAFYGLDLSGHHFPQTVPLAALEGIGIVSILSICAFVWVMSTYYANVLAIEQVKLEQEIEEHRRTEAKLRAAVEEAERAHAFEARLQHTQRLEALGTLAGGIAHEINNALVPVIALSTLVARKLPEGRERQNLGTVLAGAQRSRDLVRRILAFSRKEESRVERCDLAVVLRDALGMMRASLPATIRLEQEIVPAAPVDGDSTQLHQVIVNLVTNAAQAIGDAMGTIRVRLAPDADRANWRLSVSDTGCGMDEATRSRLFEPFFTTKEVGTGTGLGLAIVHGIIESHRGGIEVESTPSRGSRFDVVLPAGEAEAASAA
jgi:signal transduction histidine kinase